MRSTQHTKKIVQTTLSTVMRSTQHTKKAPHSGCGTFKTRSASLTGEQIAELWRGRFSSFHMKKPRARAPRETTNFRGVRAIQEHEEDAKWILLVCGD